jgi:hypothetical protein
MTFRSILVNPIARGRSLAMTRCRCRITVDGQVVERPCGGHRLLKLEPWKSFVGLWLNWRPLVGKAGDMGPVSLVAGCQQEFDFYPLPH